MRLLYFLAFLVAAPAASYANFYDGNRLYSFCQSPSGSAEFTTCVGMIAGLSDGIWLGYSREICLPPRATVGQIKDVFMNYLADRPQDRHLPSAVLMFNALKASFPCR
jgi:hypothetical protein